MWPSLLSQTDAGNNQVSRDISYSSHASLFFDVCYNSNIIHAYAPVSNAFLFIFVFISWINERRKMIFLSTWNKTNPCSGMKFREQSKQLFKYNENFGQKLL